MSSDKPLKIFIVEDNPIYQELVTQVLGSVSQDIHLFTSGEGCLKEIHNEPSVIIMDYLLEGKMNGLVGFPYPPDGCKPVHLPFQQIIHDDNRRLIMYFFKAALP